MSFGDSNLVSYLQKAEFQKSRVVIAFDGFVDEIKKVVRSADEQNRIVFYRNKQDLLAELEDETCNKDLELVTVCRKIGGTAAIAAAALAQAGVQVSAWITAGTNEVFSPLANKARLHSIGQPPLTWALEFETGKVMLSDHAPLDRLDWETLYHMDSFQELRDSVSICDVVILTGYSMLRHGHELYEHMLYEIVQPLAVRPQILIDLADISRKSKTELLVLQQLLQAFGRLCHTTVLVNRNEGIALLQGILGEKSRSTRQTAIRLCELLNPCRVVLHMSGESISCVDGTTTQVFHPRAQRPVVKTGCGDHFCAGYCLGLLQKLPERERLQMAAAIARYYIEHGSSPSLVDLINSLKDHTSAQDGPYRMIAMDFDGTILDAQHQIPRYTRHILGLAKKAGYLICACTGRSYIDTLRLLGSEHCFDYAITSNGGDILDLNHNMALVQYTIAHQAASRVMDVLDQYELYYEAYIAGQPWAEHRKVVLLQRKPDAYTDYLRGGGDLVRRTDSLRQKLQEVDTAITKFFVMTDSDEVTVRIRQELQEVEGVSCTSSSPLNVEVLAQGVDKAQGLKFIVGKEGINMDQVIAFGDGENDTNMLLRCGCGVAMENAAESLKQLVRYVCPPCLQEGAADAIKYFCLAPTEKGID